MAQWKLCFALLLPLTVCADRKEELKTSGTEPAVIPICDNSTLDMISLIVCKIRTERHSGEDCRLVYRYEGGFDHGCDSRFTLMTENQTDNQTVFLHLTSLTPVDSGNYTCECSQQSGQYILYLNITVEEDEYTSTSTQMPFMYVVVINVSVYVVITGVILGLIYMTNRDSVCSRSATSGSSVCDTAGSLEPDDPDDPDDPYTSLQQPASDLYQTISGCNTVIDHWESQEIDEEESDSSCAMYENV